MSELESPQVALDPRPDSPPYPGNKLTTNTTGTHGDTLAEYIPIRAYITNSPNAPAR